MEPSEYPRRTSNFHAYYPAVLHERSDAGNSSAIAPFGIDRFQPSAESSSVDS